jgi:hypothetical protein
MMTKRENNLADDARAIDEVPYRVVPPRDLVPADTSAAANLSPPGDDSRR